MYICAYIMYTHIYICIHKYMYKYMYIYIYIYIHTYLYVHTRIHINMYTYIQRWTKMDKDGQVSIVCRQTEIGHSLLHILDIKSSRKHAKYM